MRQFYNEDGSIAYREYIDEDEHVRGFDDATDVIRKQDPVKLA